jgi:trimeric autotransporter adhesin
MNRNLLILCVLLMISYCSFSQSVGIGTTNPDVSAALDITHTAKGLLIPRMGTAAILSIPAPAKGLMVFDSLLNQLMMNTGSAAVPNWQPVTGSAAGWDLSGNLGTNPLSQYIGTSDNQPLRFRINNIQAGELNPQTGDIFWGLRSGLHNGGGFSNIAIGSDALNANTNISNLVAVGDSALFHNGQNSAAVTDGTSNTAIGSKSLFSNTTGNLNTAIGTQALFFNTRGFQNTASGAGALNSNTTGSNGTATGVNALFSNTTGFVNTATGFSAMFSNTSGSFNSAFGEFSMHDNTTGIDNTAMGNFSLQFNTTGSQNTAVGVQSLKQNTTGGNNVAAGVNALVQNTIGNNNTAVGNFSLNNNTTGIDNTAIGMLALESNTTGFSNTAIGDFCLQHATVGHDNIAGGINALINDSTGFNNTAFGNFAGDRVTADNNNVFIGFGANNTSGLSLNNSVALGAGSSITASNQVRLGNPGTTSIGGAVGFTTLSDGRYKKNIQENVKGIDFIMKLRPVTYQLDAGALDRRFNPDGKSQTSYRTGRDELTKMIFTGFVAQEVEQAAKDVGYEFGGIDRPKNEQDLYGLRYSDFVVPLAKAIQEQQQMIEDLRKTGADLKNQNADLLRRIEKLESQINAKQ